MIIYYIYPSYKYKADIIPSLLNRPEKQELKARAVENRGAIIIYKQVCN